MEPELEPPPELEPLEPELEPPPELPELEPPPEPDDDGCGVVVEWVVVDWLAVVLVGLGFFLGFLGTVAVVVLVMAGVTIGRCVFEVAEEPQPATTPAERMASAAPVSLMFCIGGNDDAFGGKNFPGTILARCTSASSRRPSSGSWVA